MSEAWTRSHRGSPMPVHKPQECTTPAASVTRVFPLVVLLLFAAGCLSPAAPGTGSSSTDPTARPFSAVNSLLSQSEGFGEPSLGVTPAGILLSDVGSNVYISMDGGSDCTNTGDHQMLGPSGQSVPNLDPDLAVDQDGTVW